ncbi:MAG: hypothetical protein Q4F34_01445, partial [Prevotellaceae bacterium]|nr:hypothetical protein [Prevotellaceae bacterium]
MKKKIRFAFVVCAAVAALCSCTNDELVDQSANGSGNGALRFNMQVKNRTRAESSALQNTHYEFGVSGYAGSVSNDNAYMKNYLVAYASPSDTKYSTWADNTVATTWGDGLGYLNGSSYWVYEKLGKEDITGHTTKSANTNQYLKYWDETTSPSLFYAYAPYNYKGNASINGANVELSNVSSFFTQPITQIEGAVKTGLMENSNYSTATVLTTDRDIINANEVIYAATSVEKANYGNDVPFEFKHANAKIRLAFYTDITSYTVTLTDLVPTAITGSPFNFDKTDGVILTPANAANKAATDQPTDYTDNTDIVIGYNTLTINEGSSLTWGATPTKSKTNLKFKVPTKEDGTYTTLSTTPSDLTFLPTEYYAVPAPAGNTCGFTVHVSFKLNSKVTDTNDEIQVYDARCWIPATNCQWVAGNTYTYIFKITDKSSGTTNPQREDPAKSSEAYIDPSDPRVIETGELNPIEFTAMVLTEFDEVYDGLFNISGDLKTKPLVEGDGGDLIKYTEYATKGVKELEGYSFVSADNTYITNTTSITYDEVNHRFVVACPAAGNLPMYISALSYTNNKNGAKNTAYTYIYTNQAATAALKLLATEQDDHTWTVTTSARTGMTTSDYAHTIYIKNLGSTSFDATVGTSISAEAYTIPNSEHVYPFVTSEYTQEGITCTATYPSEGHTITLSGTPEKAGIYTFTFTEKNMGRTFIVTVNVDNAFSTTPSNESDDTYHYSNNTNIKIPSKEGYTIVTPSSVITDPTMAWSYSGGTFTFSNGTGTTSHTMTFASQG